MPERLERNYLPSSDHFEIDAYPFYWIARLNARYGIAMEQTLKPLNMDLSRWRVAVLLHHYTELSISEIAEHALGKMPTITKIVYRMRDEDLVSVAPSEKDGRVIKVRLTPLGEQNVTHVLERTQDLFKKAFKGMSDAQIRKMTDLLGRVFDNIDS
ncbi:MarR family transcriptional regulator [uncultured Neptuniibacter sp.]|uniref:MarR family winged helix-turn-helix transcriptional regulator n=1 Tax=uncultured Neptuniibacter sp. TaxID=502143 RepID=UPI002621595E|nr:MarR family transcriptional regulator [uncultured Neptuniibacter sp.]